MPVHHTHDFIPTPLVLGTSDVIQPPPTPNHNDPTHHYDSLPIDLTLPGHLPDSTDLAIGKIRYELQVSLELTFAQGTSAAVTEQFILKRPVVIHRIVYPSAHLQPRMAMGLDSGGVEIQIKVPRLLHCENTLLAVELYAKPRTRNVKLRKARVVFEQIETDRYQRTSAPVAVVPLAAPTNTSASSPSLRSAELPNLPFTGPSTGPPPAPRLVTRAIAQPLEVEFEEPTSEMETQTLCLQLVLSPELCVDVQSSWLQISHTLRVEIEYTIDDESYVAAPLLPAPPLIDQPPEVPSVPEEPRAWDREPVEAAVPVLTPTADSEPLQQEPSQQDSQPEPPQLEPPHQDQEPPYQASAPDDQEPGLTLLDQEGDAIEISSEVQEIVQTELDERPSYGQDEKKALRDIGDTGSSNVSGAQDADGRPVDSLSHLPTKSADAAHRAVFSAESTTSSYTCSVATEEIPVRVVRVVSTGLVDASTLAQAAGEVEAGLPTYESVIEATGLPAYAEEKLEDDREEAEASGTATGVLGGAARRLEGEDAEIERRS
ncbi:MAG: hypothetical protein J3Q66DRAFT_84756 [Benniella sp.]|nr:MAG: hypothetical protein J3Q66DRAFT_84756 [Benniella sp.]